MGLLTESGRGYTCGDHVCWHYSDDRERRAVLAAYLTEGVGAGQKLACWVPRGSEAQLVRDLVDQNDGPDLGADRVADLLERGQLSVEAAEDVYLPGGAFDPDARLNDLEARVLQAREQGFSGLRTYSEVGWLAELLAGDPAWTEYELRVELSVARLPWVALCGYDTRVWRTSRSGLPGGLGRSAGADGLHGSLGSDGLRAADGLDRSNGFDGVHRLDGVDGSDGLDDSNGSDGLCAADRLHGLDELDAVHGRALYGRERPSPFGLRSTADGAVALCGEVDYASAVTVARLLRASGRGRAAPTIDLSNLSFVDGAGATAIREAICSRPGLEVRGTPRMVSRIWDLLGYESVVAP